jgi:ethanolamine utilization protein EutA
VTGRHELSEIREVFRSPVVLTPFAQDGLDTQRLEAYLDDWLSAARADGEEIFGGGALVTGLAAQQPNSPALIERIRSRVPGVLVASAGDPCLEAWLAFQANAGAVSRANPDRWVINLDIGGGTTNIAAGKAGEVARTGALFLGARHIQVEPGTYRIVKHSPYAWTMFTELVIRIRLGESLSPQQVANLLDWQIQIIEFALAGGGAAWPFSHMSGPRLLQVPFDPPSDLNDPIYCLSGGVGELVYDILTGRPIPSATQFGDLGIDLAQRMAASPRWAARLTGTHRNEAGGATVYGLLLHATQVSGSTVYLPDSTLLPLRDVPIIGRISDDSTDAQIRDILQLAGRSAVGGCVVVALAANEAAAVRSVGERIGSVLGTLDAASKVPVALLVRENVGKALGGYISQWGARASKLIVLDEIEPLDARFVQIGSLRDQIVPVAFFGMN